MAKSIISTQYSPLMDGDIFKHDLRLVMPQGLISMALIALCLFAWLIFFTVLNMCIVIKASFYHVYCVGSELVDSLWCCKVQIGALSQQFVKMAAPMTGIFHYFRYYAFEFEFFYMSVCICDLLWRNREQVFRQMFLLLAVYCMTNIGPTICIQPDNVNNTHSHA